MKMITNLRTASMGKSTDFYRGVLGFKLKYASSAPQDSMVNLTNDDAGLQIYVPEGNRKPGIAVIVRVDDQDSLFEKYKQRGLDSSQEKDSPVHRDPRIQPGERGRFM
jgi:catechol 2,3-dioxygenase-like lactoylglutathione lyase family enzyme